MKTLVIAAIAALTLTLAAVAGPDDGLLPRMGMRLEWHIAQRHLENGVWGNGSLLPGLVDAGIAHTRR